MTIRLRLAALALAAALAACGKSSKTTPGLLLGEPSAVAAFRGYTTKFPDLLQPPHPYLAIANAATNDLTIVDAVDDVGVSAPVALRSLVYPVPGRPALLASAGLGDGKADLLVAVSAGDSKLQVLRTWTTDGDVVDPPVELGGDVVALVAVPSPQGTARIAAALAGRQIAVVTFTRDSGDAIVAGVPQIATFDFQPIALAATPDDPTVDGIQTTVWAATRDLDGVVGIGITADGTPTLGDFLNARAPTRLVAAARLRERADATFDPVAATTLSIAAFANQPTVERVYAILDESGCGPRAAIACGLVALDPDSVTTPLPPDPVPAGTTVPGMQAQFRAPIPIPGAALGLAAAQPPAVAPPGVDPTYAGTYMRIQTAAGERWTTAAAAVASTDGHVYFVDLGRWEIPGEQTVAPTAKTSAAVNPEASATNLRYTPGYTPDATWTATWEGELPGLVSRRAESGGATGVVPVVPWLALQVRNDGNFSEVGRVYDPTLGVHVGDLALIELSDTDPAAVGSCAGIFEAAVDELLTSVGHESEYPGGALRLGKLAGHPEWDACVDALASGKTGLRASVRAGGWVLVRGTGAAAALVGRPQRDTEFTVQWESEDALSCPVWPPVTSCDTTCRSNCETLLRARLARRIGYVPSLGDPQGPTLAFTLGLRSGLTTPSRGFSVPITTTEGRVPFRVVPPGVTAVAPGDIAVFDRSGASPDTASAGVRFLVPYLSNVVLDATPTVQGGDAKALH